MQFSLEELDKQVEEDLRSISALTSPRQESARRGYVNQLIPPPRISTAISNINQEILKKFEPQLTRINSSFLWTCINMLKGFAPFDQPLKELNPLEYNKCGLPAASEWCAYLVQDNDSHRSVGISRGFYLGENLTNYEGNMKTFCHYWILNLFSSWSRRLGTADAKKTYFLTDEGWRETQLPKLPPNSLIYGEFVNREGNDRLMSRQHTMFHVIDVAFLDGSDLSKLTVYMRYETIIL